MSRRKGRTKEEITYDILCTIKDVKPCNLAKIQLKANLHFYQAKTYLQQLIKQEFIMEKDGVYSLLERGKQWIEQYKILRSMNK